MNMKSIPATTIPLYVAGAFGEITDMYEEGFNVHAFHGPIIGWEILDDEPWRPVIINNGNVLYVSYMSATYKPHCQYTITERDDALDAQADAFSWALHKKLTQRVETTRKDRSEAVDRDTEPDRATH